MGSSQSNTNGDINSSILQKEDSRTNDEPNPLHYRASMTESSSSSLTNDEKNKDRTEKKQRGKHLPVDKNKSPLTGFPLVQHKCRKHKRKYDKCYNQWYKTSFLAVGPAGMNKTDGATDKVKKGAPTRDECNDLFEIYRKCIYYKMKEEREKQGLGVETLKKGSAIREFLEEEGEIE